MLPRRALVLAGPTGVGKSAVAMVLADMLGGELVVADSVQLNRYMEIGANKPTMADRARVPHHGLDVKDPGDAFSAGKWHRDACASIADICDRGRVPIVVGGTSMYLDWLVHGPPAAPLVGGGAVPEGSAAAFAACHERGDWEGGLALLSSGDPERAAELHRNDWYRLRRSLELYWTTGRPFSHFRGRAGGRAEEGGSSAADSGHSRPQCVPFFLTSGRRALNRRIDARCGEMLAEGLLGETARLLRGDGPKGATLSADSVAGRAIGYRDCIAYLERSRLVWAEQGPPPVERTEGGARRERRAHAADRILRGDVFQAFLDDFCTASRQYARRQTNWHRKDGAYRWVAVGPAWQGAESGGTGLLGTECRTTTIEEAAESIASSFASSFVSSSASPFPERAPDPRPSQEGLSSGHEGLPSGHEPCLLRRRSLEEACGMRDYIPDRAGLLASGAVAAQIKADMGYFLQTDWS